MARSGRFFLLVVGATLACLPEELEVPLRGGGGSVETSEDGGMGGTRSSSDGAQGGGGIDAPTLVSDANTGGDGTATAIEAASDGRLRDATDAATVRDVANDRSAPPRDAPGIRTDSPADAIAERPAEGSTGRDASDACVRTCPANPIALGAACADGCGGVCACALNLSCTTMIGGIELFCL